MDKNREKNINAGMTLIEVIIAVSIFSITAVVLLQSFVTSGRINRKSNLYMEATTTAQNIMEEIKAKTFEEVSLAFNYPLDSTGNARITFLNTQKDKIKNGTLGIKEILKTTENKKTIYNSVSQYREGMDEANVTSSILSTDGGKTYKFNPRKTGENASKYYFELTNVTDNHETFDALVEFDGSKSSGYKKKTATSKEKGKNDYLVPNISNLDTKSNAPFIIEKETYLNKFSKTNSSGLLYKLLKNAREKWAHDLEVACQGLTGEKLEETKQEFAKREPTENDLDEEEAFNSAKKTILIKIDYDRETEKVSVDVEYTIDAHNYVSKTNPEYLSMATCACGGNSDNEDSNLDEYFCTLKSEQNIFMSNAESVLKNIYIFYYPNYNSKNPSNPLDEIIVENVNNYPVNLYITKQRDSSNNSVIQDENRYRMSLLVKENPTKLETKNSNWYTNPSLFRSQLKLRTNLDYNIGGKETLSRTQVSQMKLQYQEVTMDSKGNLVELQKPIVSGSGAKKILDYNGLDDKKEEDRIYTAKVSVYKAGAEAKNFPDDDLIVTLDGTKED